MSKIPIAMIIDGKKISEKILNEIEKEIKEKQLKLKLAVVLVGNDFASKVYIKKKQEACEKVGIGFELFNFSSDISEEELSRKITEVAEKVSGVIIQLPLPEKFNTGAILKAIPENKDAEHRSPVICAVEEIIREHNIDLNGKKIVLVGRGKLVGTPLAEWLEDKGLEFSDIEDIKEADIIISGVGKPKLITADMVKEGSVIIDIGFSHNEKGKAVGDVDFKEVSKKASLITPVPGGVGPITVACLLKNLVNLK